MKYIIMLLCVSLLYSCNKPRTIKIRAINAVTGEGYAGLNYYIVSSKTGWDGEKYRTEASGTLNANGEAVEDIKVNKRRTYSVRIGKLENVCYHNEIHQYFDSPFDKKGIFTFEFAECAYIKLKIKNVNCFNENDSMLLFREHTISSYYSSNGWLHSGCANWETNGYSDLPMGNVFYKWVVTRNGNTETFYDTIYLNKGEYKTYNIDY